MVRELALVEGRALESNILRFDGGSCSYFLRAQVSPFSPEACNSASNIELQYSHEPESGLVKLENTFAQATGSQTSIELRRLTRSRRECSNTQVYIVVYDMV